MLHFYSYYSVGGYKDMYLGNSSMQGVAKTYYMPMISVIRRQAEAGDVQMQKKLAELEALPQIELLTKDDRYGLPTKADSLIIHSGYKEIYTHLVDDKYIIVCRDIQGTAKDEVGRVTPFVLSVMCDSEKDLPMMNLLASYIANNPETVENLFVKFLHFDVSLNALCFELEKMCSWISSLSGLPQCTTADGVSHQIQGSKDYIGLLVASEGIKKDYLLGELGLNMPIGLYVTENRLLPQDNKEKAQTLARRYQEQEQERRKKLIKQVLIAGSAVVLAGLLVFFFTR